MSHSIGYGDPTGSMRAAAQGVRFVGSLIGLAFLLLAFLLRVVLVLLVPLIAFALTTFLRLAVHALAPQRLWPEPGDAGPSPWRVRAAVAITAVMVALDLTARACTRAGQRLQHTRHRRW